MDSDLIVALVGCALVLIVSYGLWRLVHVRHSGRILVSMALLATALMIAPGWIPGVPRQLVAAGFILAIIVIFGVLYWRHRNESGDWLDVATVRYVKPISRAERIGTGIAGLLLCFAIVGPPSIPIRTRILAAWLVPIAWAIVVRGRPPEDRSARDAH